MIRTVKWCSEKYDSTYVNSKLHLIEGENHLMVSHFKETNRIILDFLGNLLLLEAVADECEALAVRRPRVDVDGALSSEELDDALRGAAFVRHDHDLDILICEVLAWLQVALVVSDENDLLAVWRYMRKP